MYDEQIPQHIAIIMDGNGRWAQEKGMPRFLGHREGAKTVREITTTCARLGVKQLTLYAFSQENWQRPPREINFLMGLLRKFLVKERDIIMENNIQLTAIGRLHNLPKEIQKELNVTREMSSTNTGMTLCLALSYSGRKEITDAVKNIIDKAKRGEIDSDDVTEDLISEHLYQTHMPDPDLLIRTGGEMRVSNFLLWQLSYSELWVTSTFWPDFTEDDLRQAMKEFSSRQRRFGKVIPLNKQAIC